MWRYTLAQSIGSAHEKLGTPCQDRMACRTIDSGVTLIAVVADGAGSAPLSHIGADIAATTACDIAALGLRAGRTDHGQLLREAASVARARVLEAARARHVPARDLTCTLLVAAVPPVGGAVLQIGDGAIVIGTADATWRCSFWPQKGEYRNATHFLTDDDALATAEIAVLPDDLVDVALLTDGLESLALHFASRSAHQPFFRTAFSPVHRATDAGELAALSRSLAEMLGSQAVRARTDDDVTLILATRRPQSP